MNEQQTAEEQEVRNLIVEAGPRAAPPASEVAAIKEAARGEWRQMVRRERRRGRARRLRGGLALAASVLVAVAVGWWWTHRAPLAGPMVAGVELVTGAVGAGDGAALAAGAELTAGAVVETSGRTGGAPAGVALRLAGGQSLRLAGDSRVRLASASRLELVRGTLYIDSGPGAGSVEVVTALGTVRDVGTQFEVRLEADASALRLRVREGECSLEAGGDSYLAARGEQLSLLGDGSVARAEIEPYGPQWDWVLATAPGIEIEARSLSVFLTWVSRETGRGVRYADPELARTAAAISLHGSTEGLAPDEALEWVLRSSDLAYELDGGSILITRRR